MGEGISSCGHFKRIPKNNITMVTERGGMGVGLLLTFITSASSKTSFSSFEDVMHEKYI